MYHCSKAVHNTELVEGNDPRPLALPRPPDRRGVPGGPDPEHHHLAHVHGESVPGALHHVQRDGAQHGGERGRRVPASRFKLSDLFLRPSVCLSSVMESSSTADEELLKSLVLTYLFDYCCSRK